MSTVVYQPRLQALTSLRFFAALHVFIFHLYAIKIGTFTGLAGRVQLIGYVGVALFFVLSGFILVYAHAEREMRPGIFYRERVARIYPAYLFSLLLSAPGFVFLCLFWKGPEVPLFAWSKAHFPLSMSMVATLTQSWVPNGALAWNPPAWSLSVEAFFYLLFPFLMPWIMRWRSRNLALLIPSCWVLSLTVSCLYVWLKPDGVAHTTDESLNLFWLNGLKFNPLMRLPEFMIGMACGVLYVRGAFNRRWAMPMVIAGLTGFAAVAIGSPHIPYPMLHDALLAPAFAALIIGLALRPRWTAFMEFGPLVLLGNASYSLYLLHSFFLGMFFMPKGEPKPYGPIGMAIGMLIPFLVAILAYRYIEEPLRRKLRPKPVAPPVGLAQPA
jgi:peptidoglycan/LPS O-acetylase OafA/YrhL